MRGPNEFETILAVTAVHPRALKGVPSGLPDVRDDLTIRAEAEVAGGTFLTWAGTHWDIDGGAAGASIIAQKVGPAIIREAEWPPRQVQAGHQAPLGR